MKTVKIAFLSFEHLTASAIVPSNHFMIIFFSLFCFSADNFNLFWNFTMWLNLSPNDSKHCENENIVQHNETENVTVMNIFLAFVFLFH